MLTANFFFSDWVDTPADWSLCLASMPLFLGLSRHSSNSITDMALFSIDKKVSDYLDNS